MEILQKAKSILTAVAPTLGTALGGPIGGMAGRVVSQALLGKENGTDKEISTALELATPAQLSALKKSDEAFKIQMKELEIDVEKIHADDRDSARKRQMALGDHTPTILAIFGSKLVVSKSTETIFLLFNSLENFLKSLNVSKIMYDLFFFISSFSKLGFIFKNLSKEWIS